METRFLAWFSRVPYQKTKKLASRIPNKYVHDVFFKGFMVLKIIMVWF